MSLVTRRFYLRAVVAVLIPICWQPPTRNIRRNSSLNVADNTMAIIIFVFLSRALPSTTPANDNFSDGGISIRHRRARLIFWALFFIQLYCLTFIFICSSMQIAILFIYNHCQVRNNIYLWSNFCQSLPFLFCHSSEITDNRKNTLRRFDKRASERSQSSERWGAKIRLFLPGHVSVSKIEILVLADEEKSKKNSKRWDKTPSRYQLYRSLFLMISFGNLGSFFFHTLNKFQHT